MMAKMMPNGNVRFYQNNKRKSGISELQLQSGRDCAQTIITSGVAKIWRKNMKSDEFAIRRITPREAWRLMGYLDSDFDKASAVTSKSQLYKQAGNAIVKQVLMAIFLQLGIQGKKRWNDMSAEERQALVDGSLDFLGEKNAG